MRIGEGDHGGETGAGFGEADGAERDGDDGQQRGGVLRVGTQRVGDLARRRAAARDCA